MSPRRIAGLLAVVTCAAAPAAARADGRGFELVSPPDNAPYDVLGMPAPRVDDRVMYQVFGQMPGASGEVGTAELFSAERGASSWSSTWLSTWTDAGEALRSGTPVDFFRVADDGRTAVTDVWRDRSPYQDPTRSVHRLGAGDELVSRRTDGTQIAPEWLSGNFAGASSDLSTVVFVTREQIDPTFDPAGTTQLYAVRDGQVELVSKPTPAAVGRPNPQDAVLPLSPNGSPAPMGSAVSDDGSQILFETPEALDPADVNGTWDVYAWQDGVVKYLTQDMGLTPGGARVQAAFPDGRTVLFTTRASLTADDPSPADDYQRVYALDTMSGDLTLINGDISTRPNPLGLDARGLAVSAGGETAVLTYYNAPWVFHDGVLTELGPTDSLMGGDDKNIRVSPDGETVLFDSVAALDAADTDGVRDVYVWRPSSGLECVSCAAADSGTFDSSIGFVLSSPTPGWAAYGNQRNKSELARAWTDDASRIFFSSAEALTGDALDNGKLKIYESSAGGLKLISPPDVDRDAFYVDATPNGSTVWFITGASVVSADIDGGFDDLYASRSGPVFPDVQPSSSVGGPAPGGETTVVTPPSAGQLPTQAPPPDTEPPPFVRDPEGPSRSAKLKLVSKQLSAADGRVVGSLQVPAAGLVEIELRSRGKTIGSGSVEVNGARTVRLRIDLNRRGRARVEQGDELAARLVARYAPEGADAEKQRWRISIRPANDMGSDARGGAK